MGRAGAHGPGVSDWEAPVAAVASGGLGAGSMGAGGRGAPDRAAYAGDGRGRAQPCWPARISSNGRQAGAGRGHPAVPVPAARGRGSLVVRFRRARGLERQQLKWLLYAVALSAAATILNTLGVLGAWGGAIDNLVAFGIPIAIGIALLSYRLYDIDRLINRTLVYGSLTAILGLGYAIAVIVLGQLLGQDTTLAVAGATLAMAAAFQPLRRRIQAVVDRRFNRRRYDATRTIEAFTTRLRDEIDLDTLSRELVAVVDQTMEPTQVSLWLRRQIAKPRASWRPDTRDLNRP
jgi:hypothetical protein